MPFGNLWGLMPYDNSDQLLSPQEALSVQRQGNLGLGAGLLAAAGPSANPISFGQALSSGLMQGQALQNNAVDSMLKRQLVAQEIQKNRLANQQIQNRPNIAAIIHNLPGVTPQQADIISSVFAVDPKAGADMLDKIPGAISAPTKAPPEDVVAISTPNGPIYLPKSQAAGKTPYYKPDAKGPEGNERDLTPTERTLFVNQTGSTLPPEIRTANQALANGFRPISPEERALNRPVPDPQLYRVGDQPVPPGATQTWLQDHGAIKYTPDELAKKQSAKAAADALNDLERLALGDEKSGPGAFSGDYGGSTPMKALTAASNSMANYFNLGQSDKRESYNSNLQLAAAKIAAAAGQRGYAPLADAKAVLAALPHLSNTDKEDKRLPDTAEMAKQKIAMVRNLILSDFNDTQGSAPTGIKFLGFEH
jgi:hypothetical protein